MSSSTVAHDLKTLILSFHPIIAVETMEEERINRLVEAVAAELGMTVFAWSITSGLIREGGSQAMHGTMEPLGLLRYIEDLTVEGVFVLKDFAQHLTQAPVARKFREVAQKFSRGLSTIVLTNRSFELPDEIDHKVVYFSMQLPSREELRNAVQPVISRLVATRRVEFAMTPDEFEMMLQTMTGLTLNQARQTVAYAALEDGRLAPDDFQRVAERKIQIIRDGGLLEYFPPEDNRYQLGGFDRLKEWLARARVGFSDEAKLLNLHPPRGILIVGIQGCGKSLAAKVIAREWSLPLLKLDAGRLFDKYIGESEKNFRKAVDMAEAMAPAVLWIDEIEKAMPTGSSGNEGDGGLSRRLFGAFLTWLQEKRHPVFVVATANDLTHTPPELLRKGRFDEIFFVDLPKPPERKHILEIHLALRRQNPDEFDMPRLVDATNAFSGAEIEQVVIASLYRALHDRTPLTTDTIVAETQQTVPLSTSRREDLDRLREIARGRFVPVSSGGQLDSRTGGQ